MVAVKMGGPMPPMGGMPSPMPLPPPMPVPPMGNPMMPPQTMPMQQGAAPVAPIMRSNAGRRRRFGDSLENMLATTRPPPVASDQMGGMNIFTGQMPRRPMPRAQMMGGTAMQPPVRRMMGGGSVPRRTDINGQDHLLAYIRPDEADLLKGLGGAGTPGPGGIPQFGLFDFFSDLGSSIKDAFTGGSSSSSSSRSGYDNNPNAGDGGGMETILNDGRSSIGSAASRSNSTSQSSADAGRQYAESMIAGGGGTNLSGSGSTAMEKLLAAQQAQTQKDDGPPPDVTGSFSSPPGLPPANSGMDYINQQFYKQQEEQRKNDEIRAAREAEAKAARDAAAAAEAASLAAQEASFNQPSTQDDASNIDIFTTGDVVPVGDPSDASNIDLLTTLPVTGGDDNTSPNEQEPINLDPVFYDMFGNPYKTQAAAQAADAEHLRKQQEAAAAESQRLALEEEARIQAEVAAREAKEKAERERIALANQESSFDYGIDPDDSSYVSDVFEKDLRDPRGDEANTMTNYLTDPIADPINTGLGDTELTKSLNPKERPEDDRGIVEKFKDDVKDFGSSLVNDIQMGIAAGLFGSRATRLQRLLDAGYSEDQANDFLDRSEDTMKKMMDDQKKLSDRDGDDSKDVVGVVDPCPDGFKLDPASGICVPVEEDETEEDEDSGDDKEDTSDDELSGVVVTPPPPTSYLDNPVRIGGDRPIRAMNRGGSVGLNRAADNFLAAMGA